MVPPWILLVTGAHYLTGLCFSFSQVALVVKNLPDNAGDAGDVGFDPWVGRILWSQK